MDEWTPAYTALPCANVVCAAGRAGWVKVFIEKERSRFAAFCQTLWRNDCCKSKPAFKIFSRVLTSTGGALSGETCMVLPMK